MSVFSKIFVTGILMALFFIPGVDLALALPVIAALGYIWGFAPTA